MRKLASIQRVWKIEPIDGADRIELAHVLGWQCVVNKGQIQPMDLAVYFEIDSFLPMRSEFSFLESSYKNSPILGEGYRLRTMKFRGQLSQGLLLPISMFPELSGIDSTSDDAIGRDVSEILGVRKWEIEERATTGGTIIGELPPDVPHTDEVRVQAMPEILDLFGDYPYYISTKMDGSSHSCSIDGDGFHVTGHNYEYSDDGKSSFYEFIKNLDLETKMREYLSTFHVNTLTVQGEFCAPGIQKNRLKLTTPKWYVFTVRIDGKRTSLDEMESVVTFLGLDSVPIEEKGTNLKSKYSSVESILERADGEYPNGGKKEGIVIRTIEPIYCPELGGPLSFKAVNNKYLLKNGE